MSAQDSHDGPWTILKTLRWTQSFFENKGIADPRLDAEVLMRHALGISRVQLYTHFDRPLQPDELSAYRALIKRRAAREPVAYIVGEKEFWSLPLQVDPRVLIPRPETEFVVERARQRGRELTGEPTASSNKEGAEGQVEGESAAMTGEWTPRGRLSIVDVGTGSGAIAIALKSELPYADLTAIDLSEAALDVARDNAARLGFELRLLQGDLLAPVRDERFHVVVSNPPYVRDDTLRHLDPEIRLHEPHMALTSGPTGLEMITRLASEAHEQLHPGGFFICEFSHDQRDEALATIPKTADWASVDVIRDPFGDAWRLIEARKR